MARSLQSASLSSDWSVAGHLLVFLTILAAFGMTLAWLLKPTVVPNPSVAAYKAPPATRLIPPDPKAEPEPSGRDAPAWTSLAQSYEAAQEPEPPKPQAPAPARKRQRAAPAHHEATSAWAWSNNRSNDSYRERGGWNDNSRGWNDNRRYNNQSSDRQRGGSWSW